MLLSMKSKLYLDSITKKLKFIIKTLRFNSWSIKMSYRKLILLTNKRECAINSFAQWSIALQQSIVIAKQNSKLNIINFTLITFWHNRLYKRRNEIERILRDALKCNDKLF